MTQVKTAKDNEVGFCERKGHWTYSACHLQDLVEWVHPGNAIECAGDPDMQLGNLTQTRAEIINGHLFLYLSLAGADFIYIWKKEDIMYRKIKDI